MPVHRISPVRVLNTALSTLLPPWIRVSMPATRIAASRSEASIVRLSNDIASCSPVDRRTLRSLYEPIELNCAARTPVPAV